MNSFLILGITREAILHIFDAIEQETDKQFLLRVSYMEIYNEEVKDLLASKTVEKRRKSQPLKVLDDSDGSVNIIGNVIEFCEHTLQCQNTCKRDICWKFLYLSKEALTRPPCPISYDCTSYLQAVQISKIIASVHLILLNAWRYR